MFNKTSSKLVVYRENRHVHCESVRDWG